MFAKLKGEGLTTAQQNFHQCPGGGWPLFTVRAGVPLENALEHATNLLGCVLHIAQQAADTPRVNATHALWAVMHLVEAANAVIEATIHGVSANDDWHENCTIGGGCCQ